MRYCNNCGEALIHLSVLKMNDYRHCYEEVLKEARYCPFCATKYELPIMPLNGKLGTDLIDYNSVNTKNE